MTPQAWLITGGAGYIGAHVADEFLAHGKDVVIYDSLYRGLESRIEYLRKKHRKEIPLVVADIRDTDKFEEALSTFRPYGIVHTAALKSVVESIEKPDEYFDVNYKATVELLEAAQRHGVKNFIFSSTAAVYSSPDSLELCREDASTAPISPYGSSKLMAESKVTEFISTLGNHGSSLRFYNVVGAANQALMDNSIANLVPLVLDRIRNGYAPLIYGDDYPTTDGTCVRDYVDVRDVAAAHLAVANSTAALPSAINIGSGKGASVREIIQLVLEGSGCSEISPVLSNRREGDSAFLCADVRLAASVLGFNAVYTLEESIRSLL
jgi:UDP-glucose 4-epimerase